MAKNTGKVGEFCQSGKVEPSCMSTGTLMDHHWDTTSARIQDICRAPDSSMSCCGCHL